MELGVLGNRVLQISITIHILVLASLSLCHPNLKISLFSFSFYCDQNKENADLLAKLNFSVVCLQLAAGALAVDLNHISVKCRSMHFVTYQTYSDCYITDRFQALYRSPRQMYYISDTYV